MKKRLFSIFSFLILFFCVFALSGCSSTDKTQSYFDSSDIVLATCDYDSTLNSTEIIYSTTLRNDTIYNITGFEANFDFYNGTTKIESKTYYWDSTSVKHGSEYTGSFKIVHKGEITSIKFNSWSAYYDSFWNTYKCVLITMIVIASVLSLIYILVMILVDLEIEDVWNFIADIFEEHGWVLWILIPIAGAFGLWGWLGNNWVSPLIVLGGLVVIIVIGLLAQLVKFIITEIAYCGVGSTLKNEPSSKRKQNDICDDDSNEENTYENYTVADLKEECRSRGLTGYSSMNKNALITLLEEDDSSEDTNGGSRNEEKKISSTTKKKAGIPTIKMDDIAGLNEAKEAFKDRIILPIKHKELFEKYGKKAGGGILLYGLPGTGKTMFAQAVANELNASFFSIKCSDIMSKWYGESEANIKQLFSKAKKSPVSVIFFDEFEAIGRKRSASSDNDNVNTVQEILAQMQGVEKTNNVLLVLAATNCPWDIDSALMRPGRFNDKIYIPLPDYDARLFILNKNISNIKFADDVLIDEIAKRLEGYNSADVVEFCDQLKMLAIKEEINGKDCILERKDIESVFCRVHSSINADDVDRMNAFREGKIYK